MAWSSPPDVRLSKRQRRELTKLAARTSAPHALVQRARMILRLASGQWPATVARALGLTDRCVRKWRGRGLVTGDGCGMEDADRPGPPARVPGGGKSELGEMARGPGKGGAVPEVWTHECAPAA